MNLDYKIRTHIFMRRSRNSKTCECCGNEIPKGDYYWSWKPLPTSKYWYAWRYRCLECKPRYYDEHLYYENLDAHLTQETKIEQKLGKRSING